MRYPSAKSMGFGILVWGVVILLVVSMIIIPVEYRSITVIASIIGIAFMLWIWFGAYYEFRDKYLLARMGPFFERIPYERITSARLFSGMPSSMALSNKMIEIRHGKNYVLGTTYISPADREGFLIALKALYPNLKDGDQLTHKGFSS